mmetsp:Transcript_9911/g.29716  ORF Transcript_9911/g.29716 Transcript_9911/m.29716 type:complete len:206 (-) Transcript_9911:1142-1759(-)
MERMCLTPGTRTAHGHRPTALAGTHVARPKEESMPKGTARETWGRGGERERQGYSSHAWGGSAAGRMVHALAARDAYNVLEGRAPSRGRARPEKTVNKRGAAGGVAAGGARPRLRRYERSVAREAGSAADEPLGASRSSRAAHAARLSMSMAPRVCTVAAHAAAAAQGRSCSGGRACSAAASARLYAAWAAEPSSATACMWRVRI